MECCSFQRKNSATCRSVELGEATADPQGNRGRIRHEPAAVLPDENLDEDTLTPLPIGVIGLLSLIVGVAILELGNSQPRSSTGHHGSDG
jgi:hypothetical protein